MAAQAGRKRGVNSKAPRPKTGRAVVGCVQVGHPARYLWAQLLARRYWVFPHKCIRGGGRVRLRGFITQPAADRQILEHIGEPSTAPAIPAARPPPQRIEFARLLAAPDTEFETISEWEYVQKANLEVEATHDPLTHTADLGAEPIPELEFDQISGWRHRTTEVIVRAARHVRVCASF